jgi:hypothetical protein
MGLGAWIAAARRRRAGQGQGTAGAVRAVQTPSSGTDVFGDRELAARLAEIEPRAASGDLAGVEEARRAMLHAREVRLLDVEPSPASAG